MSSNRNIIQKMVVKCLSNKVKSCENLIITKTNYLDHNKKSLIDNLLNKECKCDTIECNHLNKFMDHPSYRASNAWNPQYRKNNYQLQKEIEQTNNELLQLQMIVINTDLKKVMIQSIDDDVSYENFKDIANLILLC